ncbi:MAG TPA: AI-2E family transporter, partial [Pseudogracilibacillus sp.]|nr:AI-2E family transporter [Pseudogracilibacillus sp.]
MALLTVLLSFIALLFFQFEHILLIVVSLFVLDLIPYVGIGALFIPWIGYHFFMNNYFLTIQLAIIYMILIIIRQIIEPRLLSQNLGIHPLVTIIILFISIKAFSALGLLLAPLILITVSSLHHSKIIYHLIYYIKEG